MMVCRIYENEMTASGLRSALTKAPQAGGTTTDTVREAEQDWTPVDQRNALPAVATQLYGLNAIIEVDLKYPSQPPTVVALREFVKSVEDECEAAGYTFSA